MLVEHSFDQGETFKTRYFACSLCPSSLPLLLPGSCRHMHSLLHRAQFSAPTSACLHVCSCLVPPLTRPHVLLSPLLAGGQSDSAILAPHTAASKTNLTTKTAKTCMYITITPFSLSLSIAHLRSQTLALAGGLYLVRVTSTTAAGDKVTAQGFAPACQMMQSSFRDTLKLFVHEQGLHDPAHGSLALTPR